jgi:hypothetical protein
LIYTTLSYDPERDRIGSGLRKNSKSSKPALTIGLPNFGMVPHQVKRQVPYSQVAYTIQRPFNVGRKKIGSKFGGCGFGISDSIESLDWDFFPCWDVVGFNLK